MVKACTQAIFTNPSKVFRNKWTRVHRQFSQNHPDQFLQIHPKYQRLLQYPTRCKTKQNKAVSGPRRGSSLQNRVLIVDFPYLEVATLQPRHEAVDEHADVIALDAVGRQAKVIDDVRAYGQLLAGVRRL